MPRSGSGTFNLITNSWYPSANGVLATSTDWNTFISDIASALTQSVSNDGQTPMIGNLQMGGNKLTGLADGSANADSATFGQLAANGAPQTSMELVYASTTSVTLRGAGGGYLWINGVNRSVGSGITKSLGTLVSGTVYNIFAFWTGSVIDLEFSTTGSTTNSNGIPQKTGDATRTLVGMMRTNSTTTTYNTSNDCGVITFWNRKKRSVATAISVNQVTSSTTDVPVLTGPSFLSWGIDASDVFATVNNGNTLDQAINISTIYVNGTQFTQGAYANISGANGIASCAPRSTAVVPSGFATTTLYGRVGSGIGTWIVSTDLQVCFRG